MNLTLATSLVLLWGGFCASLQASGLSNSRLKTELELSALDYFIENANPDSGLTRDKALSFSTTSSDNRVGSLTATGFGLAVYANAAMRGLISRRMAIDYIQKVLSFVVHHVPRHKGWMVHMIDWKTGERAQQRIFYHRYSTFYRFGSVRRICVS